MRMTRSMTRARADAERKRESEARARADAERNRESEARADADAERKRERGDTVRQEQLLPNISDDITLQVICGKLPWSTFRSLSLVSHTWHPAIQNGQVYAGRAASSSAEMFAVVNHTISDGVFGLSLYSLKDGPKRHETLPPIPRIRSGIPYSCECIALDGKLYILGGVKDQRSQLASASVYMLNLQGRRRQWRKCASMNSPRQKFRACITNGKIYVCGGSSRRAPVCEMEVYDPETDAWTENMTMPFARIDHDAEMVHGELCIYSGRFFDANFRAYQADFRRATPRAVRALLETSDIPEEYYTHPANHVEIYSRLQDKWALLDLDHPEELLEDEEPSDSEEDCSSSEESFGSIDSFDSSRPHEGSYDDRLFMAEASLLRVSLRKILVFDLERLLWTSLRSMSRKIELGRHSPRVDPTSISAVQLLGDHVLAIGAPWHQNAPVQLYSVPLHIGVGANWTIVDNDLSFLGLVSPFIRVLRL